MWCSILTVKDFLEATRGYLLNNAGEVKGDLPLLSRVITCSKDEITRDVISKLDRHSIHRVYVVDEEENLEGVVTMRDLISKFVFEPADYFGEFFVGWAPSCPSPH
jgi:CBS-domain-containing membrane protein